MGSTCVVMLCSLLRGGERLSEFAQEPVAVPTSQFGGVATRAVHSSVDIFHALHIQWELVWESWGYILQTRCRQKILLSQWSCLALLQYSDSQTAIQMSADSLKCINLETSTPARLTTASEICWVLAVFLCSSSTDKRCERPDSKEWSSLFPWQWNVSSWVSLQTL